MAEPVLTVTNNEALNRYETHLSGQIAFAEYTLKGDVITFVHTLVPKELEGQGVGGALAKFALDAARGRGLTVIPRCPFIKAYIERHAAYADLVDPSFPVS